MRINEITETFDSKILNYIKQNCKKYLDEVGGTGNALQNIPLWRGIADSSFTFGHEEWTRIIPVRQDRRPVTTKPEVQKELDDWFQQHFGIRFRQSSVFCTSKWDDARSYQSSGGTTVIVLPVGNYDYCWSPDVGDLFIVLQQNQGMDIPELLDISNYQYNKGLIDAIESENEIMIRCQSVMLINPNWPALHRGSGTR